MADKTITQLTATTSAATADEIPIWVAGSAVTRKITKANFLQGAFTGGGTLATGGFTLYLPALLNGWHAWFTDSELDAAMRTAGYDPATASMHTVCTLDPTAVPPYLMRYTSCDQYYVDGQPTEGTDHFFWYLRMGNGIVTGLEVGQ